MSENNFKRKFDIKRRGSSFKTLNTVKGSRLSNCYSNVSKFYFCLSEICHVVLQGASVVLYKNEELRKHQIFAYSGWPGGLFGSPSMAGTRPGISDSKVPERRYDWLLSY